MPGLQGPPKAALLIKHGNQREADARLARGTDDGLSHRHRFCAICTVMKIMKLHHVAVSTLEHLCIGVGGDCLHQPRRHACGKAVHHLAPRPEIVTAGAGLLGQATHGALEGMAMRVDERWHQHMKRDIALLAACADGDVADGAIMRQRDARGVRPPVRHQGMRGKERRHHHQSGIWLNSRCGCP